MSGPDRIERARAFARQKYGHDKVVIVSVMRDSDPTVSGDVPEDAVVLICDYDRGSTKDEGGALHLMYDPNDGETVL